MTNKKPARCMLFHPNGGSEIFEGDEAIQEALDSGYEDSPFPVDEQPPENDDDDRSRAELIAECTHKDSVITAHLATIADRDDAIEGFIERISELEGPGPASQPKKKVAKKKASKKKKV